MKPDISLAGFINSLTSLLNLRNLIIILGVLTSIVFYYFLADYYLPFKRAAGYLKAKHESYKFYAGGHGGFYHQIGEALEKFNESGESKNGPNINIKVAEPTSGGLDNAIQVLSGENAFGLIQESTLSSSDELRENISYISPIYMERLHIICRTEWLEENGKKGIKELTLKKDQEEYVDLFEDAKISIGEVGSGTRVIASYLLEVLKAKPQEILGLGQKKGLEALMSDSIDIFITIVGAPLAQYTSILEGDNAYKLIGISPPLAVEINERFSTNYRVSSFKSKYKGYDDINTVGSYCYLISSKDVDESMNIDMLRLIAKVSGQVKENLKIGDWTNRTFQLDEIKFQSGVDSKEAAIEFELFKSLLLFLFTILISSFFAVWILIWIFSSMKMARYFRLITHVYKEFYPETYNLNRDSAAIYLGNVPVHGSNQINKLILGIDELRKLKTEERADYESGGISESHFRSLLNSTQWAIEEFRSALTRIMAYDIKQNDKNHYLNEKVLCNYLASSFLTQDQFEMLKKELQEKN